MVDEPFIGLDPKAYRELTNLLIASKGRGAGVLVSTHVLDSAERLCDRFLILHQGRLVAQGTLEQLRKQAFERARLDKSGLESIDHWTLLELFECLKSIRSHLQREERG